METVRYTAKLSLQENLLWGVSLNLSFLRFIVIFLSKPCSLTPTLTEFLNMAVVLKPDNSCPVQVNSTEQSLLKNSPTPTPTPTGLNETLKTAVKV